MLFVRFMLAVMVVGSAINAGADAARADTIQTWDPNSWDVASTDFNTATDTFTGFTATSLDSIQGGGYPSVYSSAIYHNHGNGAITFSIELQLDGVWTNVWSDTPAANSGELLIEDEFTGVTFSSATVTGIRLSVSSNVNQAWHYWNGPTASSYGAPAVTFNFGNTAVPEPATLALFGLGAAGMAWRRRRQRSAA